MGTQRTAAILPETLHPEQRLKLELVEALSGIGRTAIYKKIGEGTFPAPECDGPRCSRWRAGDVLDWLQARRANQQAEGVERRRQREAERGQEASA